MRPVQDMMRQESELFLEAPFTVLDNQTILDCSHWPAGDYLLKEAYRNDLGQVTESWLNLTINNRPAPAFSLDVFGNQNNTDEPCLITMIPNMIDVDFSTFEKIWTVQGTVLDGNSSTSLRLFCFARRCSFGYFGSHQ